MEEKGEDENGSEESKGKQSERKEKESKRREVKGREGKWYNMYKRYQSNKIYSLQSKQNSICCGLLI